jgi:CDP-glycerol glycerophosphotransferase (TagB/SpsB family)
MIKLHGSTAQKYKDMYRQLAQTDNRVIYLDDLDITPYLAKADVLISDVSSVMMEFAALGKPVVLFNNPLQKTYKNYNPNDLEYTHRDIGYQVSNLEEMKLAILKIHRGQDPFVEKRQQITDQLFANKYDGKATERIIDIILHLLRLGQNEKVA